MTKQTKQAIVPSKLPDADFVINPYIGCEFGCKYCYASFMSRFINKPSSKWGNFVYPKKEFIAALEKQLRKPQKYIDKKILFGSVTDAYQPVERKEKLTLRTLQTFINKAPQLRLEILTKSALILRDIKLLQQLNVTVGISISILPSDYKNIIEPKTPSIKTRLKILSKLKQSNISTYAFIAPVFPNQIKQLKNVIKILKEQEIEIRYIELLSPKTRPINNFKFEIKNRQTYKKEINNLLIKYHLKAFVITH